jgi:hypothetical protein
MRCLEPPQLPAAIAFVVQKREGNFFANPLAGTNLRFLAILFVALLFVAGRAALAADLDATQMLVEAANHGRDDPAIHSGAGEVDEELHAPPGVHDESTLKIEHDTENLRASLPLQTDARQRASLEQGIAGAEKVVRDTLAQDRTYSSHWRVVFNGQRPNGELRREVRRVHEARPIVTLGLREKMGGQLTIQEFRAQHDPNASTHVTIVGEPFWDIPWFPDLGREIIDREKFVFKGATVIEQQTARFLPSETVDGHELRVVEAKSSAGTKRHLWIDPARGFVCPRIESYDSYDGAGRLVRKQEASGFFQEPSSGVWFAERQVKTEFDPQNGKQLRRTSWHLDRKSLQINQSPAPEEFSLPIQATTMISDQRPGGRQWRAATSTSLRLVDGMLDLERTPGLTPLGPPHTPWEVLPKDLSNTVRWVVTVIAAVVTVGLLALVWFLKLLITRTRLVE